MSHVSWGGNIVLKYFAKFVQLINSSKGGFSIRRLLSNRRNIFCVHCTTNMGGRAEARRQVRRSFKSAKNQSSANVVLSGSAFFVLQAPKVLFCLFFSPVLSAAASDPSKKGQE